MPTIMRFQSRALRSVILNGGLLAAIAAGLLMTQAPAKADTIWDVSINSGPVQGIFQIDLTNGVDTNLTLPGTFIDSLNGTFELSGIPSADCASFGVSCIGNFNFVAPFHPPATSIPASGIFFEVLTAPGVGQNFYNPTYTASPVPEPASLSFMVMAILAGALWRECGRRWAPKA